MKYGAGSGFNFPVNKSNDDIIWGNIGYIYIYIGINMYSIHSNLRRYIEILRCIVCIVCCKLMNEYWYNCIYVLVYSKNGKM